MVKVFRKIRQNLIEQRKFSRYLLYALGEIILVVAGILIALQINNLNEANKNREYEEKMLSEIRTALQKDMIHFENMVETYNDLYHTADYFMELSKNNVPYHDSLFPKVFDLNDNVNFQFNSGPYEALKSSGIDKISNDSLRNEITNLYDFELPILGNKIEHITRNHQNNIESMLEIFGERFVDDSNGKNFVGWSNIRKDLFQSQGFLQILAGVSWRGINAERQMKNAIPKVTKTIQLIDIEIK